MVVNSTNNKPYCTICGKSFGHGREMYMNPYIENKLHKSRNTSNVTKVPLFFRQALMLTWKQGPLNQVGTGFTLTHTDTHIHNIPFLDCSRKLNKATSSILETVTKMSYRQTNRETLVTASLTHSADPSSFLYYQAMCAAIKICSLRFL